MKLPLIVLFLATVLIAAGCATQSEVMVKDERMAEDKVMMAEEGFEMINGKMMMVNEKTKAQSMMTSDISLQDGSKVMTDGTVIRKDGSSFVLKEGESMWMDGSFTNAGEMMDGGEDAMMGGYQGTHLAGTTSLYYSFTQADFDKALAEGKTILLYFYANWCPTCKAEQPKTIEAFNELSDPNIIGFRVNFKDSDTDADETALAKQFGITYQHTKVIIKDGKQVQKSLESWSKEDYLQAFNEV